MDDDELIARLLYIAGMPRDIAVQIDAKRRLDINLPRDQSWSIREIAVFAAERLKARDV